MAGVKRGFTILELLVVMAIIAILAGLGAKGYSLARRQAKEDRARAGLEKLRTALEEYRIEFGAYPEQDQGGSIGNVANHAFLTGAVEGLELVDPWGRHYQYERASGPENRFLYRIWSEGQDADAEADDIVPSK